ncbi:MAG: GNAT family N-acetyltransferase [Actinophytocola sp.]|nr:GNAT family N-acetyltransferase [Actinophytocola sp.]
MEPIEINAGTHYLRQFRADDRLDDRSALLSAFADPAVRAAFPTTTVTTPSDATAYIDARAAGWRDDDHYTWAVAALTTGTLIGEVRLDLAAPTHAAGGDGDSQTTARLTAWTHPDARGQGVASTAVGTVLRFGFGAIDLARVEAACAEDNAAAMALARRCGFGRDSSTDDHALVRWTTHG